MDQIANKYGGWSNLCDPRFYPSEELYAEFESEGCPRERLDEIRSQEAMAARQRILLDVSDDLLRTWSRYLAITRRNEPMPTNRFVAVPGKDFWSRWRQTLSEHSVSAQEIELFIGQSSELAARASDDQSSFYSSRLAQIASLARLCRNYPPPAGDTGLDVDPSLVPVGSPPYAGGTAVALALPEPTKKDAAAL